MEYVVLARAFDDRKKGFYIDLGTGDTHFQKAITMHKPPIIAFLPCRAGSERVVNKNTRSFAKQPHGLIGLKIKQLISTTCIDQIVLSSNDSKVFEIAQAVIGRDSRLVQVQRPEQWCTSSTSTDDLIMHALSCIQEGIMLWTHVTSPFIGKDDYTDMIEAYFSALMHGTNDSLATVTVIQKFLWNEIGPINYDRKVEKWPRTQTLKPIYELNSGAFIVNVSLGRILFDRIGEKPLLYPLNSWKGFDIDWEEDFAVGEHMYEAIGPLC